MRFTVSLALLGLVTTSALIGACHKRALVGEPSSNLPMELVLPNKGIYTGAYIDFGEAEEDVTLEVIEEFETMTGKHQAIIASSSYWGEQDFPKRSVDL